MFRIGSHISSAKGYLSMGKDAARIGANTLQFFLRNPRGGRAKALDPGDIAKFLEFAKDNGIGPILAHASYTLNPATIEERLGKFVRETVTDDLERMEHTPGNMYNLHPGHAKDGDRERAAATIAETLDYVMKPELRTVFLLETMVGNAGEMGGTFEELRDIIDHSRNGDRVGVCLDTCHVFAAGYDVVNDLDGVLTRFDNALGLERLKAVHLNDSMYGLGEGKDRHAKIGEGRIGLEAMGRIVNHPALRELPFYLETPNDLDGYAHEIAELKKTPQGRRGDSGEKEAGGKRTAPAKETAKGMMSHMCIDTTVRSARGRDCEVVLLRDACTTRDLKWEETAIPAATAHGSFMAGLPGAFAMAVARRGLPGILDA